MRSTLSSRPVVLGGVVLAAALTLSTCGASSTTTTTPKAPASASASHGPAASGPHNAADVTFASDMVPHHTEAV